MIINNVIDTEVINTETSLQHVCKLPFINAKVLTYITHTQSVHIATKVYMHWSMTQCTCKHANSHQTSCSADKWSPVE